MSQRWIGRVAEEQNNEAPPTLPSSTPSTATRTHTNPHIRTTNLNTSNAEASSIGNYARHCTPTNLRWRPLNSKEHRADTTLYMGVSRYMRLLSRFRLQTTYSPENSRSWAAVSFGTLTFGIGLIPSSGCSRQNCLIIDITRSSEIKNSCSERTLIASSKRSRCTSVQ